jgi:hypothetical protein
MIINRVWAMPNKSTFLVKPIGELVRRYIDIIKTEVSNPIIIDPFANNSIFKKECTATNDLNPEFDTTHHMESLDFLKSFGDNSVDLCLFDPPWTLIQISREYKNVGRDVHMRDTSAAFYGDRKKEVARIMKKNGIVVCCAYNSGGIGKTLGFNMVELLICPHGGSHYDSLTTIERKIK